MTTHCNRDKAEAHLIHVGGEHGTFFVRTGVNRFTNTWLELTINSTFGTFVYTFGSIGSSPVEFLSKVYFDYLMGKLMGRQLTVVDLDKAVKAARKLVIERRRSCSIDSAKARTMWDEILSAESECGSSEDRFFHVLAEDSTFYDWDICEIDCHRNNPQAVGFWEKLWPAFLAELKADRQAVAT